MSSRKTTIKFPDSIDDTKFENLLSRYYPKSRDTQGTVIFDLQSVTWCDPFNLSLLTLWIMELASLKIKINVLAPLPKTLPSEAFLYFLQSHHFVRALGAEKVPNNFPDWRAPPIDTRKTSPVMPLTFMELPSFQALLNDLRSTDRLNVVLRGISEADIVTSGAIRDVVIAELGSNFFYHAKGRFAHLSMTKSGEVPDDKLSERVKAQLRTALPSEKAFFQTLGGRPYVALVFSDKGIGIPQSIRKAYSDDPVIREKSENPTDGELLQYAFLYHSTGRTIEARIGQLCDTIANTENIPPPTGLYQLRKIVREYRGMLVVRSGKARLVEDFLSDPIPKTSIDEVSDFGGTQYKLCIPFYKPRTKNTYTASLFPPSSNLEKLACVQLSTALPQVRPVDNQASAAALTKLFETIECARLKATHEKKSLVIDAKGVDLLPSNALFYLQLELMRRQEPPHQYSIIVNAPSSLPEIHSDICTRDSSALPTLIFDQYWKPRVIGLQPEEETFFKAIINKDEIFSSDAKSFANKHPEWFQHHYKNNTFEFLFTESTLKMALRSAYAHSLREVLADKNEGFFFPDEKVLLPSKSYCHGYFDISKFTDAHNYKNMLHDWVAYSIERYSPSYVVTIGATAADIVSKASFERAGSPKILSLATPVMPNKLFSVSSAIPTNSSVVIITDVIGTSKTLKGVFKQLRRGKITVSLAVVDATDGDESSLFFEGEAFVIEALIKHKLTYYLELPAGWDYDEISQVDPQTHTLIPNPRRSTQNTSNQENKLAPLWADKPPESSPSEQPALSLTANAFLEDAVIPATAILEGHYESPNAHMAYLFNIPALLSAVGDRITDLIFNDVKLYLEAHQSQPETIQIAYPDYNLGLDELANSLSALFPASTIVPMSKHILDQGLYAALKLDTTVIFLDDAMYSGNTIFKMLDLADTSGVKNALVYTILRRGHSRFTNRIRKILQYGKVQVLIREVASIEIPVFELNDCPLCAQRRLLKEIDNQLPESSVMKHQVAQDLDDLAEKDTRLACREETAQQVIAYSQQLADRIRLRWMLEKSIGREELGARHTLTDIVRDHKNNTSRTLRLFEVLMKERIIFLQNNELYKEIFYPSLMNEIISAVEYFARNLEKLTTTEAQGVLAVFAAFESAKYLDCLPEMIRKHQRDNRLCWFLLRECFVTQDIKRYPSRVLNVLKKLRAENEALLADTLLTDVFKFWEIEVESQKQKRTTISPLSEYLWLVGPDVHNLGKDAAKLIADINFSTSELSKDWRQVNNILRNICANLLRFIEGLQDCIDVTNELHDRAKELDINRRSLDELVDGITKTPALSTQDSKDVVVEKTNRVIELLDSQAELSPGIRKLLGEFHVNVVTGPLIQLISNKNNQINISRKFPKAAPLVFGQAFYLHEVFSNIVENALEAGAKNLLIHVDIKDDDQSAEFVEVVFLNDGRPVDDAPPQRHGIVSIMNTVSAFGGHFQLRRCLDSDPEEFRNYKTLARVKLRHIPEFRRTT